MEKTKVIIFGGKGTAINIAEGIYDAQINHGAPVEFIGFAFDDDSFGNSVNGFPILCKTTEAWDKYKDQPDVKFIFQMNRQDRMMERADLIKSYQIPDDRWFTFVHPSAFVAKSVQLGHGTVVYVGCAIHPNTIIGNHCTFCALTTIGHDCNIGNHVFTATHVCIGSSVNLGNYLFFGQNAIVSGSVSLEGNNLIGLGASIIKDFKESNKVIVGQPGKVIRNIN